MNMMMNIDIKVGRNLFPQLSTARFLTPQDVHRLIVFATCTNGIRECKV
jgi:hypothetical protein